MALTPEALAALTAVPYKVPGSMEVVGDLKADSTLSGALAFSGARIFSGSSFSVPNNADTPVPFDSERYDTDGYHSGSSTQIVIPKTAKYHVGCTITMDANSVGRRYATLRLNGTYKLSNLGLPLNLDNISVPHRPVGGPSCDWLFNVGDYVELVVFQDSGGPLNLSVFADQATEMWIHRLGA